MNSLKIKKIFDEQIVKIRPDEKEILRLNEKINEILLKLNKKLKGRATAMLGGSFAKNTVIKKDRYDADVFVKFFKNPDSDELEAVLKSLGLKIERIHGSRDYFRTKIDDIFIEIVPIMKLDAKDTENAENVTDVSPFHVDYIKKKIAKNPGLADEIRLAKAFCYALGCYGAESHIRGFSGYCLEVLISYYGSFINLMKAASKWKDKVVLDPEGYYKKSEILRELNESKLISPLVIIDPVQKNRNVSAALSEEKFNIFKNSCKKFLLHPSEKFFEKRDIENEIINKAKKSKKELLIIEAESLKNKEDVAGAKLIKFQNILKDKLEKEGYSIESFIKFLENKAKIYFLLGKKDILVEGPFIEMKENVNAFKKKWKKTFVKGKRIYAIKKKSSINWRNIKIDKKILEEMSIKKYKIQSKI